MYPCVVYKNRVESCGTICDIAAVGKEKQPVTTAIKCYVCPSGADSGIWNTQIDITQNWVGYVGV